ncbi:MAG: inorganic diphosphatase [Nocardioides sp.]|uniref:inorganic diphosphatase n=1 Tax=Nocardioides sp. TaxID=35761 RepID=UPI0039E55532
MSDLPDPEPLAQAPSPEASARVGARPVGTEAFDVVVEVPGGSRNKYEMDKPTGRIYLDRTLFTAARYPADYGYVEHTLARDGDPIDALVLVAEPTFPGCLVRTRAVGVYQMSDENGPDEKLLCVPAEDPRWEHLRDIDDVPTHLREEIAHFFDIYKALEPGKHVDGSHWEGTRSAYAELHAARRRHLEHGGRSAAPV